MTDVQEKLGSVSALSDLMGRYNEYRKMAKDWLGREFCEEEFNAWFTSQVFGEG